MTRIKPEIEKAIELLHLGESFLPALEEHLESMTVEHRIILSDYVALHNIPAPRIVHYNYQEQIWYSNQPCDRRLLSMEEFFDIDHADY